MQRTKNAQDHTFGLSSSEKATMLFLTRFAVPPFRYDRDLISFGSLALGTNVGMLGQWSSAFFRRWHGEG